MTWTSADHRGWNANAAAVDLRLERLALQAFEDRRCGLEQELGDLDGQLLGPLAGGDVEHGFQLASRDPKGVRFGLTQARLIEPRSRLESSARESSTRVRSQVG